jgi:hypothetical protein
MEKRPCQAQSMQETGVVIIGLYEHLDARHIGKSIRRKCLQTQ